MTREYIPKLLGTEEKGKRSCSSLERRKQRDAALAAREEKRFIKRLQRGKVKTKASGRLVGLKRDVKLPKMDERDESLFVWWQGILKKCRVEHPYERQFKCEGYHLDFAWPAFRLAVEVSKHGSTDHDAKRWQRLKDVGWTVLYLKPSYMRLSFQIALIIRHLTSVDEVEEKLGCFQNTIFEEHPPRFVKAYLLQQRNRYSISREQAMKAFLKPKLPEYFEKLDSLEDHVSYNRRYLIQ